MFTVKIAYFVKVGLLLPPKMATYQIPYKWGKNSLTDLLP